MEVDEKQMKVIQGSVIKLRQELTPSGKSEQQLNTALIKVIDLLPQLSAKLISYISSLDSTIRMNSSSVEKSQENKILLYYFQLVNLILIHANRSHSQINIITISKIIHISSYFSKASSRYHSKTLKALLILYFNLLKRLSQLSEQLSIQQNSESSIDDKKVELILPQNPLMIFQPLQSILHSYLQSNKHQKAQNELKFKEQTEWMAMIFQLLPTIQWKSINHNFTNSFLSNYFQYLQTKNHQLDLINSIEVRKDEQNINSIEVRKDEFNILHMLGNFLNVVIESRTSTELIKGYECPIADITKMYSNPITPICNLKLNQSDAFFLCQLLIAYYNQQKRLFREMFINKDESVKKGALLPNELVSTRAYSESDDFHKMFRETCEKVGDNITTGQLVLETLNILNNILFLGGYNPKLQQLIYHSLFANNILPEFLELSYLIYNQRRIMSKYNIKLNMAKPPDANLSQILSIDYANITHHQRKSLLKLISLEIKFGQLSLLLRLMSNLLHINARALTYFQQNIRYLHIVMSLSHESEINLTMKNWAVLLIKNCCDSPRLRDEINKVKIEMKVDQ